VNNSSANAMRDFGNAAKAATAALAEATRYIATAKALEDLIPEAVAGATIEQLRERLTELVPGLTATLAHRYAQRLHDQAAESWKRSQKTRQLIADTIAGWPRNSWWSPVIVNAAPIGAGSTLRPSVFTRLP
jgi:hypothetical protein